MAATSSGGGVPIALALITGGGVLIYSAFKGGSILDVFANDLPTTTPVPGPDTQSRSRAPDVTATGATGQFKGPHAAQLEALRKVAQSEYHLTVSQICRPQDATYGAPNSLHKACRAMDLTGSVADRVAFARYAAGLSWVDEVFCDQAGMVAPGYDHSDHVHVGA